MEDNDDDKTISFCRCLRLINHKAVGPMLIMWPTSDINCYCRHAFDIQSVVDLQ